MKMTSTFKVLALGGALMAIPAPFSNWTPLAALVFMSTLVGALAAHLVEYLGLFRLQAGDKGVVSSTGPVAPASLSVATLLVWTMRSMPAASASCMRLRVPSTLARRMTEGSRAHNR